VFSANEFITLSAGDGPKTVYVRYYDNPGNFMDYSASINLDTTPPSGSIKINSGSAVTITRMVNLTIDGKDKNGVKEMIVSNLVGFNGSAWEPFKGNKLWNLTMGEGSKVVYVKFRDTAGLEGAAITDAIQYNPTPNEGVITINNGTEFTNERNVTLHIEMGGPGDVTQMMVSNEPGFKNISWQTYENDISWELTADDATKYVYIKFLTPAGIETDVFNANITLDTIQPEVLIKQPVNGTIITKKTAELRIKATDARGIGSVEVSMDDGPWTLAIVNKTDKTVYDYTMKFSVKGTHTVKVRASDVAGNTADTQETVIYKPPKKKQSPFMDTALILAAVVLVTVAVGAQRKKRK